MSVILISQKYLSDKSIINNNTDYNLLTPVIVVCQDLKIMPLLGSDLYNLIVSQVQAGTIAGDNKTLLDNYILPALLWYVASESPLVLKFRFMNMGVVEKSNDNNSQTSTEDIKLIEDRYSNWAENYGNQMIKFIKSVPDRYPLYFTSYGVGKTSPDKSAFTAGGLYLDEGYGYRYQNDMGDFRYRDYYYNP